MGTTIHDLRRTRPAPRGIGGPSALAFAAVAAVAAGGLAVAYLAGAFGHHFAPANTLAGVYDRYVDALERIGDQADQLQSPADLPAKAPVVGPKLMAVADEIDGLTAKLNAIPAFNRADLEKQIVAHRSAETAARDRFGAAVRRLPRAIALDSPMFPPLVKVPNAADNFRGTAERLADAPPGGYITDAVRPGVAPTPSAAGAGLPDFAPPHMFDRFPPDQIVTVHVRGLTRATAQAALIRTRMTELPGVQAHYDKYVQTGSTYDIVLAPVAGGAEAAAARVDFGSATADAAAHAVVVDADVAKLDRPRTRPPSADTAPPTGETPPQLAARMLRSVPAGQVVTVRVRGLTDRSNQLGPLESHLMSRCHATNGTANGDADDFGAATLWVGPAADAAAVAAAVDFGRTTVDAASRVVTVDVDPAKADAIVNPPATPAAAPPMTPLSAVVPAGTKVEVRRGADWLPATVLSREGRRYRVHFMDDAAPADRWVTKDQMRPAPAN